MMSPSKTGLLRRNLSASGTTTKFAETVNGWDSIDYTQRAVPNGTSESLDGGLFAWNEPIEFELVASNYLIELSSTSIN